MQEEVWAAAAGGRVGREEAEGFFDDGEGVGELVEQVWGLEDGLGRIRAEDLTVLGADFGESFGVRGKVVVAVADCVGGCAVAGEDETF